MPPGFARARRRPQEHITYTTEDTYFTSFYSLLFLQLSFFHFCSKLNISHSQVYFMMSSIHWFSFVHLDGFSHHQIEESRQNTGTHHFCGHGCACLQKYGNYTGCDPLVRRVESKALSSVSIEEGLVQMLTWLNGHTSHFPCIVRASAITLKNSSLSRGISKIPRSRKPSCSLPTIRSLTASDSLKICIVY